MAKRRYVPILLGACVVIVFVGGILWIRSYLGAPKTQQPKVVQEVHLIRPPPPPPPEEKPPPPPPEEKVDVPDPQNKPDPTPSNEPPPNEQLGLDAEGGAGGDAFGLIGNKGGRDLMASGGSAYAWYAGLLKNQILDALGEEKTRPGGYTVRVLVWVRPDGSIERVNIAQSSGDPARDRQIEAALMRLAHLSQAPPPNMPEPISLRIVSRG